MKCKNPVLLTAKDGTTMPVPCGHCCFCRVARAKEWSIRIMHEIKFYTDSAFITLTYNDLSLPLSDSVIKNHVVLFIKRLRKEFEQETGLRIKYFFIGEYGDIGNRPHYHGIIFGINKEWLNKRVDIVIQDGMTFDISMLSKLWSKGFVDARDVIRERAEYVAQYTQKKLYGKMADYYWEKGIAPEFMICSQGIGKKAARKYLDEWLLNGYTYHKGRKFSIPKYYFKLLSEDERKLYSDMKINKFRERRELLAHEKGLEVYDLINIEEEGIVQRERDFKARKNLNRRKL